MTTRELVKCFYRGADSGHASSLSIRRIWSHGTALFSYDEPIAHRIETDFVVFVTIIEHDYSPTTNRHIALVRVGEAYINSENLGSRDYYGVKFDKPLVVEMGDRTMLRLGCGLDLTPPRVQRHKHVTLSTRYGHQVRMGQSAP